MAEIDVNINYLVRTEEKLTIDPKNFLHCANISEVYDELQDYIYSIIEFPKVKNNNETEILGLDIIHNYKKNFFDEWQRLKNLPKEF